LKPNKKPYLLIFNLLHFIIFPYIKKFNNKLLNSLIYIQRPILYMENLNNNEIKKEIKEEIIKIINQFKEEVYEKKEEIEDKYDEEDWDEILCN
jgi:hypothetical protein